MYAKEPILALATPPGKSAIAVIRLSGKKVIELVNATFRGKDLTAQASHTVHLGDILDQETFLDEVLVTVFRTPRSFTLEDSVEVSCHGSPYIIRQLIQLFIKQGARLAKPGEFTQRAFLNGRFDLAQAEAVADLIAADSALAHRAAWQQMRGGFSTQIQALREKLIHLGALLELELDFSEEDVTFADRPALQSLVQELLRTIIPLIQSFELGNLIKNGIPTVIVGRPNVGKSTLLNALLNEEKAIVSPIPGTTRDLIEDEIDLGGVRFRFIDTAGLRDGTTDMLEIAGMARTRAQMQQAALILYVFDLAQESLGDIRQATQQLAAGDTPFVRVGNKLDAAQPTLVQALRQEDVVLISAAQKQNLAQLQARMRTLIRLDQLAPTDTIVASARHHEQLVKSKAALEGVLQGIMQNLTSELLALDVRRALHHLGEITSQVTTEDLLDDLFAKFCIGK